LGGSVASTSVAFPSGGMVPEVSPVVVASVSWFPVVSCVVVGRRAVVPVGASVNRGVLTVVVCVAVVAAEIAVGAAVAGLGVVDTVVAASFV